MSVSTVTDLKKYDTTPQNALIMDLDFNGLLFAQLFRDSFQKARVHKTYVSFPYARTTTGSWALRNNTRAGKVRLCSLFALFTVQLKCAGYEKLIRWLTNLRRSATKVAIRIENTSNRSGIKWSLEWTRWWHLWFNCWKCKVKQDKTDTHNTHTRVYTDTDRQVDRRTDGRIDR